MTKIDFLCIIALIPWLNQKEVLRDMKFNTLIAPTIRQMFVDQITHMILAGDLKAGDALPTERELAEKMQISKSAAHIGLSDLQRMGFVHIKPRHKTTVADYWASGTLETLDTILRYNGGRLNKAHTRSILECRMALEGIAIDRVAQNRTEDDLARLNAVVSDLQTAARQRPTADANRIAELMFQFQHLISILSRNSIFPLVMNAFRTFHLAFWKTEADQLGADHCLQYAKTLLDSVVRRDSAAAKVQMQQEFETYLASI